MQFLDITGTIGSTEIVVGNKNPLTDYEYLKYLWITDSTGHSEIVPVLNVTASAGAHIYLEANTLADIDTVHQAHIVRLTEDAITEDYLTSDNMTATFKVQELQGA